MTKYKKIAQKYGYVIANRWLGDASKRLKLDGTPLYIYSHDEPLREYCKAKSKNLEIETHKLSNSVGVDLMLIGIENQIEKLGITCPLSNAKTKEEKIAGLARICDETWLRRKLRCKQQRELDDFLRQSGTVYKNGAIYLSDEAFDRFLQSSKRNLKLLASLEAENEMGQTYTLAELQELSPSNPTLRRNELMVRANGFESFANSCESPMTGLMITLTCPSRFHAFDQEGIANQNHDGSTPSDGQSYLNETWAKIRASLERSGIEQFGIRVAEPHHDGTPHWHLFLFFKSAQVDEATTIFKRYALQESPDEAGAQKYRIDIKTVDPKKGSATGYIAKYIAKNIDGQFIGEDSYGKDAVKSALRVRAWASVWGIRQFQQIGGASITVYRELRRLKAQGGSSDLIDELIRAADEGDWQTYCELMGGVNCRLDARPLRPLMIKREDENKYGEVTSKLKGLLYGTLPIISRIHEWTIRKIEQACDHSNTAEDGVGEATALINAPPLNHAPLEFCL